MNPSVDHSKDLTDRILARFKKRFYVGQEVFFHQEIGLLKQAIFYPARYLDERSMALSVERYESILLTVLRTVIEHGDVAKMRSPGRYLLHAVQQHMKHHGETYLGEAKKFSNALDAVMRQVRNAKVVEADATVPTLAAAHKVLAMKSGRKKKVANELQGSLFLPDAH